MSSSAVPDAYSPHVKVSKPLASYTRAPLYFGAGGVGLGVTYALLHGQSKLLYGVRLGVGCTGLGLTGAGVLYATRQLRQQEDVWNWVAAGASGGALSAGWTGAAVGLTGASVLYATRQLRQDEDVWNWVAVGASGGAVLSGLTDKFGSVRQGAALFGSAAAVAYVLVCGAESAIRAYKERTLAVPDAYAAQGKVSMPLASYASAPFYIGAGGIGLGVTYASLRGRSMFFHGMQAGLRWTALGLTGASVLYATRQLRQHEDVWNWVAAGASGGALSARWAAGWRSRPTRVLFGSAGAVAYLLERGDNSATMSDKERRMESLVKDSPAQ